MKKIAAFLLILSIYSCKKKDITETPEVPGAKKYYFSLAVNNNDFITSANLVLKRGNQVIPSTFIIKNNQALAVIDNIPEQGEWTVEVEALGKIVDGHVLTSRFVKNIVLDTPVSTSLPQISPEETSGWLMEYYRKIPLQDGAYVEVLMPYLPWNKYIKVRGSANLHLYYGIVDKAAWGESDNQLCDMISVGIPEITTGYQTIGCTSLELEAVFSQANWFTIDQGIFLDTNKGLVKQVFAWSK